jgi:hypothetical protein
MVTAVPPVVGPEVGLNPGGPELGLRLLTVGVISE